MSGPSSAYMAELMSGLGPPTADQVAAANPPPPVIELDDPLSNALAAANRRPVAPAPGPVIELDPPPAATPAAQPTPAPAPPAAGEAYGPPVPAAGPPAAPAPTEASRIDPTQVEFRPVGGGSVPAHEAYLRGPKQDAHLMASFEPPAEAASANGLRSYLQAEHEQAMYERQANAALDRQQAAEAVLARRQLETQSMLQDYQDTVQQLGQMKLDQNRWWGNQSTGEKIANVAAMFAGGFFGGPNGAAQRIYKNIDQDIEAQKFDYQAGLDQARSKQTAFGMLMQKYGSEDAAEAAARAAALDYAAAKVQQEAAQWKGTAAQSQTAELLGNLASQREQTIANGFKFIPAAAAAPKYQMAFRGHIAPGLFTEKEAQANFIAHQTAPAQKADEIITTGEVKARGDVAAALAKAEAEAKTKGQENAVVLPNGQTVVAPSPTEATKLRDLSQAVSNAQQLVDAAIQIRSDPTWIARPEKKKELERIGAELTLAFKDRGGLGALSGSDMDLAKAGTANITGTDIGTTKALEGFKRTTQAALQNRVRTIPGAPDNAQGKLSPEAAKSLKTYGK